MGESDSIVPVPTVITGRTIFSRPGSSRLDMHLLEPHALALSASHPDIGRAKATRPAHIHRLCYEFHAINMRRLLNPIALHTNHLASILGCIHNNAARRT